jgi:hypothetical protein
MDVQGESVELREPQYIESQLISVVFASIGEMTGNNDFTETLQNIVADAFSAQS